MESPNPLPKQRVTFLSAGPGTGKTALLKSWQATRRRPSTYFALSPEDGVSEFFFYRFLKPLQEIQERYEELTRKLPDATKGGVLGLAIAEVAPDFCLLLDDYHHVQGTPLETELVAMFRHFPETGTLVVASRNQAPVVERPGIAYWNADHPIWQQSLLLDDLLKLRPDLQAQLIALHVVGEFADLPDAEELVRRNFAYRTEQALLAPWPSWRGAAEGALSQPLSESVWELVAMGLKAYYERHRWTAKEQETWQILNRVPAAIRQRHSVLLVLAGAALLEAGRAQEGGEYFRQAIAACSDDTPERFDARLHLAHYAKQVNDIPLLLSTLAQLRAMALDLTPHQQAQALHLEAFKAWYEGDSDSFNTRLRQVLAIPAMDDCAIHREHYAAYMQLYNYHYNLSKTQEAAHYAEQLLSLATSHHLDRRLLDAYSARLSCTLFNDPAGVTIQTIVDIPNRAFRFPVPGAILRFVKILAERARLNWALTSAQRYFSYIRSHALRLKMTPHAQASNLVLLSIACHLGNHEEAKRLYDELTDSALDTFQRSFVQLTWAANLVRNGHEAEGKRILQAAIESEPIEAQRQHAQFALDLLSEAMEAPASAQSLLGKPDVSALWRENGILSDALGLPGGASHYQCTAFGELTFSRNGAEALQIPRRKAFTMLGYLVLNPEGIPSETLAVNLFDDAAALDPLHTVAYSLRQGLKKLGTNTLLEATGGMYRLRWRNVGFCDVHEFDALFQKARSLETDGHFIGATHFYELSLLHAQAPLFEDLPDEFESARAAYQRKINQAKKFIERSHGIAGAADSVASLSL